MKFTLTEAARIAGGTLTGDGPVPAAPEPEVTAVAVDSRRVPPGALFVALAGTRADGHDFVEEALANGAVAAMVGRPMPASRGPLLVVDDPLASLRRLAVWTRDLIDPAVVGITGSTGKTSTKDLLRSVAGVRFATAAAEQSFNNELGVPLTLLQAGSGTEVLICELGARGVGQIHALCGYVRPDIGVVTNVGVTHFEQFGSVDAIVRAKSELIACLPAAGFAVLNADDPAVAGMAGITRAEVLTYGLSPQAWLRGDAVQVDHRGRPSFRLLLGNERAEVQLQVSGRHQVLNALAAAAAGCALGLSLGEVVTGLEAARASRWRMEVTERDGVTVVNDAYNANPTSVRAALETCAAMVPAGGRLVAVLGYMAELGDLEAPEHRRVGTLAGTLAQRLVVVGDAARPLAEGAGEAGLEDIRVVATAAQQAGDLAAVLEAVGEVRAGDVILVKASRVAGLERLAAVLAEGPGR